MGTLLNIQLIASGMTSLQSTFYAHGLPSKPDEVYVQILATSGAISTTSWQTAASIDALGVTVLASGQTVLPALQARAIVFHSIVR